MAFFKEWIRSAWKEVREELPWAAHFFAGTEVFPYRANDFNLRKLQSLSFRKPDAALVGAP